jgi:2-polyprenyl-3-methyl-5-hydroxy-6-metoxy-1,4-benzoquinol methylase
MTKYGGEVDLRDINNAHSLGVLTVRPGSRVLDVGAASGIVASALVARGCRVWAVEIDKAAACEAEEFCERVVVGDVEAMDLESEFRGLKFDYILFLDVLEHLVDPAETLRRIQALLAPGGRVVASIPNVTHAAVRLQLLKGSFAYTETGLLDSTHLRFFDRAGVEKLFREAHLVVRDDLEVTRSLTETEIEIDLEGFASEVLEAATADANAETYQFFIVASPPETQEGGVVVSERASLTERLQNRVRELEQLVRSGAGHVASLEQQITERDAHVGELEGGYRDVTDRYMQLEAVLRDRMIELQKRDDETKHLQRSIVVKDAYISDLRERLVEVEEAAQQLRDDLEAERATLATLDAELGRLRPLAEYGVAARQRAAYRLADAISLRLSKLRGVFPFARWVVRRLFRP